MDLDDTLFNPQCGTQHWKQTLILVYKNTHLQQPKWNSSVETGGFRCYVTKF